MFNAWLNFWAETLKNKPDLHVVRDPLAAKGAGDISSAAVNAHSGKLRQSRHISALV